MSLNTLNYRQKTLAEIDLLEVNQKLWDMYMWGLNTKVPLKSGKRVPLFQRLDPELINHRRRYVMDATGFDEGHLAIWLLDGRGHSARTIAPRVSLSEHGVRGRIERIGDFVGSNAGCYQSTALGLLGLDGFQLIGATIDQDKSEG